MVQDWTYDWSSTIIYVYQCSIVNNLIVFSTTAYYVLLLFNIVQSVCHGWRMQVLASRSWPRSASRICFGSITLSALHISNCENNQETWLAVSFICRWLSTVCILKLIPLMIYIKQNPLNSVLETLITGWSIMALSWIKTSQNFFFLLLVSTWSSVELSKSSWWRNKAYSISKKFWNCLWYTCYSQQTCKYTM